jgi:hypothetical protein
MTLHILHKQLLNTVEIQDRKEPLKKPRSHGIRTPASRIAAIDANYLPHPHDLYLCKSQETVRPSDINK